LLALTLAILPVCAAYGSATGQEKARAMDQFIRGTVADEMQDHYRAVFHYQEALRYDSTSPFIYVALAQDYVLLGNTTAANDLLEKALSIQSNFVAALELKSVLLRGTGKLADARVLLRKLLDLKPENEEYARQLLSLELALGNFSEAENLCTRIESLNQQNGVVSRQVLSIFLAAGQYDRAIKILHKLMQKDSTDAGLIYALGASYLQKGDTTRATGLLTRANVLDPTEPKYWIALAVLTMDQSQYAQVVALADSALSYIPSHPTLFSLRGGALYRLGKREDAIQSLRKAVELDTTLFVAMGTLALIYDELDSVGQAIAWYERAIPLSDSAAVYLNNLAYTYAQRGMELLRARQLAVEALKRDPKNGAYLDTMGWIEFQSGNYDESLIWLLKANKVSKGSSSILEHLGDAYSRLGKLPKAKKYYQMAFKLDPQNGTLHDKANR
jgi:tetratricopeptide (TPR) repeat protein